MKIVPILILSGFLGSGKTTFLTRMLDDCLKKGIRPAVIMNEVGDVNLDGQLVNEEVPMSEMLSGCICCTIRGDLAMETRRLIDEAAPDLIFIEATGVANPIEILDAITEAAMLTPIEIRAMITVVDAAHFLHRSRSGKGKTYRLMTDQIRCASMLVLNKSDLAGSEDLKEIRKRLAELNPFAPIVTTAHCEMDEAVWSRVLAGEDEAGALDRLLAGQRGRLAPDASGERRCEHDHGHEYEHDHNHDHKHEHEHEHEHGDGHSGPPHSYDHVVVCSHYFSEPIDGGRLERMMKDLPAGVYRAKGIFTSSETGERVIFQYAYRQLDLIPIRPQGQVQDVAVFIGEHFSQQALMGKLEEVMKSS
ncbi:GTP-binding protein [uncultured Paenibacillus sp.]|uniref:CobW family GTP-binding protein n=1 Tax=uncultured Paenibacillus sp. TaxID=227322 RepID=UPI0015AC5049|nr:GTP-binding protein [uncultured Paenibacillus sp.]